MKELSKTYNPKEVEGRIYKIWERSGCFNPDKQINAKKNEEPFVIVIPPPNVTGSLHMGHALNNTIQDLLIRRKRMMGVPTLWLPGTDHAGIATETKVEKKLAKQNIQKNELGKEKFIKEVWKWKEEFGHIIIDQLKKLGCSCDWSRERFTMDAGYEKAVQSAFVHYYKKGYIYQGERVINWCPRCQTSLSDLEVEHINQKANLYFFKYDKNFPIAIATTRPETKLGDTAVAVNPKDKRYKKYIGKTYKVKFAGVQRDIKIIADNSVDMNFGTGAVGVTPAHSLLDYELALKYNLPLVKVINQYGKMTLEAGKKYAGLKSKEAGEKIVDYLKNQKLLQKETVIDNNLSICYRCERPIEPIPSVQWFLKMDKLAKPAIKAVVDGRINFYPARWKKIYLDWMENIRDWCISRQIWWGHKIPVYTKQEKLKTQNSKLKIEEKLYVGSNPPKGYKQVEDVLDTWFSSALWPFAVFGWPEKTPNLKKYYPTSILSTARDIIYLWVARMIFSGLEFMGEIPFSKVYIHPTVFNKEGKRMSKSLGTGVDPLELIEKYGTDATRFGLIYQDTGVQDIKFSEEAILAGKKFANKIWNAARYVMMNIIDYDNSNYSISDTPLPETEQDHEILDKLSQTIKNYNNYLDNFRFGQTAHLIYDFFWHDFCDTYLEASKTQLKDLTIKENTQKILLYVLTQSLKLLHPLMPFLTEEIYQNLSLKDKAKFLMISDWPK